MTDQAGKYLDADGHVQSAQGVTLFNPDGTLAPIGGSGGGSGGAITAAAGAIVDLGAKNDTAWDLAAASPSLIGVSKAGSLTLGAPADAIWAGGAAAGSIVAVLKNIATSATPAGANLIGKVGIDQTTPGSSNGVVLVDGATGQYPTRNLTFTDAANAAVIGLVVNARLQGYNGATMDRIRGDANGLVVQSYALSASRWSYAAPAGGIVNSTTAVTLMAAAGAGVRNYLTGLTLIYQALTTATEVVVRDGAGGTVIYRDWLPSGAAGRLSMRFDNPRRGTANTLMELAVLTATGTGTAVYVNADGFQGS